ncbi:hypothetical protein [Sodalis praecaptivus]|uniref:hypothetical protein n=1 Tax=Sodalis praecaptivus TaxID=1239307 RepID=UPI0027F62339|nr:hypothetical protein [Sodalis praecaptivus]CAJ0993950.1 hypothetical protein NVIRENTERO_01166 [Sodalis praecaptivus]
MDNNTIKANNLINFPLLKFMESSDISMGIKSNDSRFVYMNEASKDWCDVPQAFDYKGRYDQEFPCPWAAMADEYQTHDRKAESSRCGAEIISTSSL